MLSLESSPGFTGGPSGQIQVLLALESTILDCLATQHVARCSIAGDELEQVFYHAELQSVL